MAWQFGQRMGLLMYMRGLSAHIAPVIHGVAMAPHQVADMAETVPSLKCSSAGDPAWPSVCQAGGAG